MQTLRRPSGSMIVAMAALFIALGGAASANGGLFDGHQIKPGTVGHKQLADKAVQHNNIGRGSVHADNLAGPLLKQITAPSPSSTSVPVPGPKGDRGDTGAAGPAGSSAPLEATESCTPDLCIQASDSGGTRYFSPASDGTEAAGVWFTTSGGGWMNADLGHTIDSVKVGQVGGLVVTLHQPNGPIADGSIDVNWDPHDFDDGEARNVNAGCNFSPSEPTGSPVPGQTYWNDCRYHDMAVTDGADDSFSDAYAFKAVRANPDAVVTVTARVNGEESTAQFPIAITG
jgi:hypothetical protein